MLTTAVRTDSDWEEVIYKPKQGTFWILLSKFQLICTQIHQTMLVTF